MAVDGLLLNEEPGIAGKLKPRGCWTTIRLVCDERGHYQLREIELTGLSRIPPPPRGIYKLFETLRDIWYSSDLP